MRELLESCGLPLNESDLPELVKYMTVAEKLEFLQATQERQKLISRRKLDSYYPDAGPLRRELYSKHLQFFAAGANHRERLMLAANRIGKTEGVGGYELTLHLTGQYPAWWNGRRFDKGVRAWVCGDTSKTVREILQQKLLGPVGAWGTGLLPGDAIERVVRGAGIPDTVDTAYIRHISGQISQCVFKSYDQRREAFQGTEQDIIWEDEEPPLDIHTECLLRTMTNNGMVMLTFTPLLGMSEVVLQFLPDGTMSSAKGGSKYVCIATWDDAPHLSEEAKKELWESIPPYQRDARSKGVPQLGSGAIYPVGESTITVEPFSVPDYWPRVFGMDVGWNCTASVWGALNRETDILYLHHAYKRGQAEPDIHATEIKRPGIWIPGVIDPAANGRSQKDGMRLMTIYQGLGLKLDIAENSVEAGIYDVWQRMVTGRLKIFKSLTEWFSEFRLYRRDMQGRVVKDNDHLMDCTRYLVMSGIRKAIVKPIAPVEHKEYYSGAESQTWMA